MANTLYYGDNLDILKRHVKDESVDLVYLDPPFKSNSDYNILFAEKDGTAAAAQIKAFEDTWRWDQASAAAYRETVEAGGKVSQALQAFRILLGENDMLAYLSMMAPRLLELHRVLKPTGSLYLHCDATASHYLKILLDATFGAKNYRREVIWRSGWVSGFKTKTANWVRNHDVLHYYVKSLKQFTFNKDLAYHPHGKDYKRRGGGENPRGVAMDDVWDENALYSPWIKSFSNEKLGYMTQKPIALLERIIGICSAPGEVVLDPFCGCGTTIEAAEKLGREWIGIDITHLAITLIKHRLGRKAKFTVVGEPVSLPDAESLAATDPYQFQVWALGLVGARPALLQKGADRGIDGRLLFHDDNTGNTKQVIFSVKAGHLKPEFVREIPSVVSRENAQIGVLIAMQSPTKPMRKEAASHGHYHSPGWNRDYPTIQIVTVEELLAGKVIDMPPVGQVNVTFQKGAAPATGKTQTAIDIFSDEAYNEMEESTP